jgi:hypothetical protein
MMLTPQTVPCKPPKNCPRLKSELFQELEGQCYPVLKLEVEVQTFTRVEGSKVDLTLIILSSSRFNSFHMFLPAYM